MFKFMAGGSVVLTVMCSFRRYRDSLVFDLGENQPVPTIALVTTKPLPQQQLFTTQINSPPRIYLPQLQEAKAKKKVKLDEKAAAALTSTPSTRRSTEGPADYSRPVSSDSSL